MKKNIITDFLLIIAIFSPLMGLLIIWLDDLEFLDFSESIKMVIFMASLGVSLVISSSLLLRVNKYKKDGEHVSSAPYAGKVSNLSKGQALFFNVLLLCIGLFCLGFSLYVYLE